MFASGSTDGSYPNPASRRFTPPMQQSASQFLSFTASVFDGAVSQRRELPKKGGDPESGQWYRDLPEGTAKFIPAIREFAKDNGKLAWETDGGTEILSGRISGQILASETGIGLPVTYGIFGVEESRVIDIPYPDDPRVKRLCMGDWVQLGVGAVRMPRSALLPSVGIDEDDNVVIEWHRAVAMRLSVWQKRRWLLGWLGGVIARISTTQLRRFVITPDYIDVQLVGAVRNNMVPRLVPK